MAKLSAKEMRGMSVEELLAKLRELRAELAKARATAAAGGSTENPSQVRQLKRMIARILTVIGEKQGGR
ncbi:MAG: 50S ribosomal protein L29 [Candidatus Hadarchaeales archaeon]